MDDRHRKFYIGDTNGTVRLYNVSNGVLLKSVGEEEITPFTIQNGNDVTKKSHADRTGEISGLRFVDADHLLITAAFDSTLNVYDEENPDTAPRLRRLAGGHASSEVTCLAYSPFMSIIATGCSSGAITIWDYEMSRVEGICHVHTREVLQLEFLEQYPILVSSSADGFIYLWGMRGCELRHRFSCVCALANLQLTEDPTQVLLVRSMTTFVGERCKIPAAKREVSADSPETLRQKYQKLLSGSRGEKSGEEDEKMAFLDPGLEEDAQGECTSAYLFTGDERGRVRIWDLGKVLARLRIRTVKDSYRSQRPYFNPRRKGDVDATAQAHTAAVRSHIIAHDNREKKSMGPLVLAERGVILREMQGHQEMICCMSRIDNPPGFVTASYDRHFKVWSLAGELWGNISTVGENPVALWKFPIDWSEERKHDKEQVLELIKEIEPATEVSGEQLEFETYDDAAEAAAKIRKRRAKEFTNPKRSLVRPDVGKRPRARKEESQRKDSPTQLCRRNCDDQRSSVSSTRNCVCSCRSRR